METHTTVLRRLVNLAVSPGLKFKKSSTPFVRMENISNFLAACRSPPLSLLEHDIFLTVDLYERKDPAQVLQCLAAFSRRANAIHPTKFTRVIGPRDKTTRQQEHDASTRSSSASSSLGDSNKNRDAGSTATPRTSSNTISQYGYTGLVNQRKTGTAYGQRRDTFTTTTTPYKSSPKLFAFEETERQQWAHEDRKQLEAGRYAEEAQRQREAEIELEEQRAKEDEQRRWAEETRKLRAEETRSARKGRRRTLGRETEDQRSVEEARRRWQEKEREIERQMEMEKQQEHEQQLERERLDREEQVEYERRERAREEKLEQERQIQAQEREEILQRQQQREAEEKEKLVRQRQMEAEEEEARLERQRQREVEEKEERLRRQRQWEAEEREGRLRWQRQREDEERKRRRELEELLEKERQKEEERFKAEEGRRLAREAEQEKQRERATGDSLRDSRLNGQFLSQYQATRATPRRKPVPSIPPSDTPSQPTPESERVKQLERQLEEAKQREKLYQDQLQAQRTGGSGIPALKNSGFDLTQEDERLTLRSEWQDYQQENRPIGPPQFSSRRSIASPALPPRTTRPLPDPVNHNASRTPQPQSRTDRFLKTNPPPLLPKVNTYSGNQFGTTAEVDAENSRRVASTQKTRAGGWASKSLLEREMERERQRQAEWEAEREGTKAASAGSSPPSTGNKRGVLRPLGPRPPL